MTVYVVFGLAGAGKTYFADWAAQQFGIHVEDADHWLTDEMRQYIRAGKIFTPAMLNDYFAIVGDHIASLKTQHDDLIISQALYREQNRQQLLAQHHDIQYILVTADRNVIRERILTRADEVTLKYAEENASYFQMPSHPYVLIENSHDQNDVYLHKQCQKLELFGLQKRASIITRMFGMMNNGVRWSRARSNKAVP